MRWVRTIGACGIGLSLAGCAVPADPEAVHRLCEDRARAAQGPTGEVTVGTNSTTGGFSRVEIGITSDFIAGRDPVQVYDQCVFDRTGALPDRAPNLR